MKKVIAISALLALILVSASMASVTTWRFDVSGATPDGTSLKGTPAQLGVNLVSNSAFSTATDNAANQVWAAAKGIGSDTDLYKKQTQSNATAGNPVTWTAYVAANANYPGSGYGGQMLITIKTPLASFAVPARPGGDYTNFYMYTLKLDGVAQVWDIYPVDAAYSTLIWSKVVTVRYGGDNWAVNGYKVDITQTLVPEPSGFLALGTGLMVLVGIATRRRRA